MTLKLNKSKFVSDYVSNFCSTWAAINYDNFCIASKQDCLAKPPVEDAVFLAEES